MQLETIRILSSLPTPPHRAEVRNHKAQILSRANLDLLQIVNGTQLGAEKTPESEKMVRKLTAIWAKAPELLAALDDMIEATASRGHGDHKDTVKAFRYASEVRNALIAEIQEAELL